MNVSLTPMVMAAGPTIAGLIDAKVDRPCIVMAEAATFGNVGVIERRLVTHGPLRICFPGSDDSWRAEMADMRSGMRTLGTA